MRIVSVVLMFVGLISSSASAAPTACELISAADMSAVLGSAVATVANNRGGPGAWHPNPGMRTV